MKGADKIEMNSLTAEYMGNIDPDLERRLEKALGRKPVSAFYRSSNDRHRKRVWKRELIWHFRSERQVCRASATLMDFPQIIHKWIDYA